MPPPLIALLSDFGSADAYVGVMKGVILSICPEARLVDLTHEVPPHDVRAGAFFLAAGAPFFPAGTIFLAVVDPGVGSARKGIIAQAGDSILVGPDNGLFTFFLRRWPEAMAYELARSQYRLPQVSSTFHGRDVFAPAAGWAARGIPLSRFGPPVERPISLAFAEPLRSPDQIEGSVLHVDRFGNLVTNLDAAWLAREGVAIGSGWLLRIGQSEVHRQFRTYAEAAPGEPVAVVGSSGFIEIALREQNAARALGAAVGDKLTLVRAV